MNSIDMKKMINIKECLKHLALLAMFLLVGGSVFAQTEPKDDEVFDLVAYEDGTEIKFKNGNESVGYLRMPNNQDPSHYIFTNKKYIRVSVEGDFKVKTSVHFHFVVKDDKYQKGTSNSTEIQFNRPRGYYVLDNSFKSFELLEGKKFQIAYSENTYHDNPSLTIETVSGKERTSVLNGDTLCFMAGDTIKSFRVKRERRGLIDKILFKNEHLVGTYKLSDNPVDYADDDIIYTVSSFTVIDEKVLSNETICFPLEVHLRYLKEGNLVPVVKTVMIKVEKEKTKAGMIPLWVFIVLFIVGVALFVVLTLILIKKKKKDGKEKGKKKEKVKEGENPEIVKDGLKDGGKTDIPSNEGEQVFEKISNEDAAKCLLNLLGKKDTKVEIEDLKKELSKLWVKKFCEEWNSKFFEYNIDRDKFNKEFIFTTIYKLQKDAHEEGVNEALQKYGKNAHGLNLEIKALKQDKENTRYYIQAILTTMSENHYPVKTTFVSTIKDGLKAIQQAIEEDVQNDELQQKITELENSIAAQKDNYDKQLSEKEREHQQALNNNDKEHEAQMTAQKEVYERQLTEKDNKHQQALNDKGKAHEEQMKAKETAHQQELERLNQAHAGTVANLNATIQAKNTEIEQLKKDGHQDCISFINMVVKRMNGVGDLLNELYDNVYLASGEHDTQYSNILRKAKEDYELFAYQVTEANVEDRWLQIDVSLNQVCEDLQTYVTSGLRNSGWVNIVHYLNLYAGATEKLNDSFNENGLSTVKLAKLVADIQRLLGMFGVKVVVPHLLMDKFDDTAFEFENADRWIQAFAPDLKPNDYETRIFDMSVIGYQMDDRRYNKPRVFYS